MVLSPSTPSADLYAATCNPPRKAKRARVETDTVNTVDATRPADNSRTTAPQRIHALAPRTLTVPQTVSPHNVRIRPAPASVQLPTSPKDQGSQSTRSGTTLYAQNTNRSNTTTAVTNASQIISSSASNSALASNNNNNNSQLPPPVNAPKKRGRKPTGTSRSQREALRKINHSKIEKARRSKINTALDALKKLVPSDYGKSKDSNDMDSTRETGEAVASSSSTAKTSKKEEKEREFKLDILERTVLFVQDLVEKVERLEQQVQQTQSGSGSGPGVWVKDTRSGSGSGSLSRGTCVCGRPYPYVGTSVVWRTLDADAVEGDDDDDERDLDVDAEQSEDEEDQDEEVETDDEDVDEGDNREQPEVVTKPKSTSLRNGTMADDVVMADASRTKTKTKVKTMAITREQDDISEAEERIHAPTQMSLSRSVHSNPDTRARAQTQAQAQAQAPTYTRPSMSLSPAHTHTSTSASDSNSSSQSRKIRPSSSTVTLPSISSWLGTVSNFTSPPSHHGSASISPALLPRLGSSSSLTSSSSSRLQQHVYSTRGYSSPGIHPNTTTTSTGTGLLTPALTGSTNATTTNTHTHVAATDTPLTCPVASPPLTIMTPASGALGVVNGDATPPSPFSIGPSRAGLGGVELRGVAPYTAPGALGMIHSGTGVYGHARGQASAGGTGAEGSTNSPNMSMLPPPASPYPVASSSVHSMSRTGESMYSSPRVHAQGGQGQGQGQGQSHSWSGKKSKKRGIDESERDGDVLMTDRTRPPSSGSRESFMRSPVVEPARSRAGSMPQIKAQVRQDVYSTQIVSPPTMSSQRVSNITTSPSTSIPTHTHKHTHTYAHSRSQPPSTHTSPVVNWTREDESAASLLLHMSTSPVVGRGRSVSGTPAGFGGGVGMEGGDKDKDRDRDRDRDVPELVLQMSESTATHQQKTTRTRHEVDSPKAKEHTAVMQMDTVRGRTTETSRSTSPQSVSVTSAVSGLVGVGVGVGAHTPGSLLGIRPIGTAGRSQESE